jgi:hypothetical protein
MGNKLVTIKIQEVLGRTNHLLFSETTQTAQKKKGIGLGGWGIHRQTDHSENNEIWGGYTASMVASCCFKESKLNMSWCNFLCLYFCNSLRRENYSRRNIFV